MSLLNDFFEDFDKRSDRMGLTFVIGASCILLLVLIFSLSSGTPDFKLIRSGVTKLKVTKCGKEITISDPTLLKVFFDDLEHYSKVKHKSFVKTSKSIDTYYCQFRNSKGRSKIEMCFNTDGSFDLVIVGDFANESYAARYSNLKIRDFVDYNIKPLFHCLNN